MKEAKVSFRSGPLSLEGVESAPAGAGTFPAVIVCHPHPSLGGSMDNNVVIAICEALFEKSIVTLRFNFRGVGRSEGSFAHGIGEQEDVQAAVSFLAARKRTDRHRLGLAGYSAGAVFGVPVAVRDERVRALAAISLPIGMMDLEAVKTCPKPKLFVTGSKDDFASVDDFSEFCRSCVEPKECLVVEGADHFWQGYETDLAGAVSDFFSRALASSG